MSPTSLLFSLPLFAVASAFAQNQWVESPATLTLTHASSGQLTDKPGKNQTVIQEGTIQRVRLGNRDVLEALQTRGLIDQIQGWRVVGIWAEWPEPADPYVGNAYRFYARRGAGSTIETVAIPSDILSIQPLQAAVGYRHVRSADDFIRSGTETFSIYQRVTFDLAGHAGIVTGIETGGGRYVPVSEGTEAGRYLPAASKAMLQGEYAGESEETGGVVSGTLSFGPAKLVQPAASYDGPDLAIGNVQINGVAASATTGGTLTVGGSGGLIQTGTASLALSGATLRFPHVDGLALTNGTLVDIAPFSLGGTGTLGGTTLTGGTLAPGSNPSSLTASAPLNLSILNWPSSTLTVVGDLAGGTNPEPASNDLLAFLGGNQTYSFSPLDDTGAFLTGNVYSFPPPESGTLLLGTGLFWTGATSYTTLTWTVNSGDGTLVIPPLPEPAAAP